MMKLGRKQNRVLTEYKCITLLEPPRPIIFRMKNCLPLIVMDSFEIEVKED